MRPTDPRQLGTLDHSFKSEILRLQSIGYQARISQSRIRSFVAGVHVHPYRASYNMLMVKKSPSFWPSFSFAMNLQNSERSRFKALGVCGSGVRPDCVTYNTLLEACVQAGAYDAALGLYRRWRKKGQMEPDQITIAILLVSRRRCSIISLGWKSFMAIAPASKALLHDLHWLEKLYDDCF
jgi:pentatricopeptide repeat protein